MAKILISGPIVSNNDKEIYEWFGMEATAPRDVKSKLDSANGEDIDVEINSGGGSVFDGSEIYTALKDYKGNVTVKVVGLAASAASVIAMAGKRVLMSPTAQLMIHNVSARAGGDFRDMAHMSEILKNANITIANAYRIKSGMDEETLLDMMNKETWLTSQQALDYHLIDEVMFESNIKLAADFTTMDGTIPPEVINKIKNEIRLTAKEDSKTDIFMQQKAEIQFRLLQLKGKN